MSFQPRQNRVQLPWFIFELNLQEGEIRNMSVKTSCWVLPEVDGGQRTFIFMLLRHVNHNRLQSAILKSSTPFEIRGFPKVTDLLLTISLSLYYTAEKNREERLDYGMGSVRFPDHLRGQAQSQSQGRRWVHGEVVHLNEGTRDYYPTFVFT